MGKKGVYKFYWDCGRMGYLDGIFVATDSSIRKAIGQDVYFGEVLGKHSEIDGSLEEEDVKLITDDKVVVAIFEEYKISCGFNPLDYIVEEEEDIE